MAREERSDLHNNRKISSGSSDSWASFSRALSPGRPGTEEIMGWATLSEES